MAVPNEFIWSASYPVSSRSSLRAAVSGGSFCSITPPGVSTEHARVPNRNSSMRTRFPSLVNPKTFTQSRDRSW